MDKSSFFWANLGMHLLFSIFHRMESNREVLKYRSQMKIGFNAFFQVSWRKLVFGRHSMRNGNVKIDSIYKSYQIIIKNLTWKEFLWKDDRMKHIQ